jgi:hypothetical protein
MIRLSDELDIKIKDAYSEKVHCVTNTKKYIKYYCDNNLTRNQQHRPVK